MSAATVDLLTTRRAERDRARLRVGLITELLDHESVLLDRLESDVATLEEIRRRRALRFVPPAGQAVRGEEG